MKWVEQLEKGNLRNCVKRKAGNKRWYKTPLHRLWRRWMKQRKNDGDKPMYNRYNGYEL